MNNKESNRYSWEFMNIDYSLLGEKVKKRLIEVEIRKMFNKTIKMFKYNNLPDTVPQKDLELITQVGGSGTWYKIKEGKHKGEIYYLSSGLGGKPNAYYLPTLSIVANPYLELNKTLEVDKDCVVMLNDDLYMGLMPINNKYAILLVEAELSLMYAIWGARIPQVVEADNQVAKESAEEFFNQVFNAEKFGVIGSKAFFEGIKTFPFYQQNHITELIESIQYIKGSWYNELGLSAAFNMKREAINESEALVNEDILKPLVDTMLKQRQIAIEKVNKMFGTNITVELDSIWKTKEKREKAEIELLENEGKVNKEDEKFKNEEGKDNEKIDD